MCVYMDIYTYIYTYIYIYILETTCSLPRALRFAWSLSLAMFDCQDPPGLPKISRGGYAGDPSGGNLGIFQAWFENLS